MKLSRLSPLLLLAVLVPATAAAQAPRVAPPTRPAPPAQPAPPTLSDALRGLVPEAPQPLPDYAEEMRVFIEKIAAYARSLKPDFTVVMQNGLELLQKQDDNDPRRKAPARTLLHNINGVLQTPLYFGKEALDAPLREEDTKALLELTELAKRSGKTVLVMDYGRERKTIDQAHRLARKQGYVSYVAEAVGPEIRSLARYPSRPYEENANSVLSLAAVRNFLYLRDSQGWGRQDEFALKLHARNHDMLVVDVLHGRTPLQKQAVETLKYKKLGARRLVLAYLDIGRAASHRHYWKTEWRSSPPEWLSDPIPEEPDSHYVKYWLPGWQEIIAGGTNSYLYGIFTLGFDGVVLDGADAVRYFEGR